MAITFCVLELQLSQADRPGYLKGQADRSAIHQCLLNAAELFVSDSRL